MFRSVSVILFVSAFICSCTPAPPLYKGAYVANYKIGSDTAKEARYIRYADSIMHLRPEFPLALGQNTEEALQFVWLRSFHPAVYLKIEKQDKEIRLHLKEYPLDNNETPSKDTSFVLAPATWNELKAGLEQMQFGKIPSVERVELGCADGATWDLEYLDRKQPYHYVRRHCTIPKPFKDYCVQLIRLSGYKVKPSEIY